MGKYFVYVISCKIPYHYYIGLTSQFNRRISAHKKGRGAKFTKVFGFKRILFKKIYSSISEAKETESRWTNYFIGKYGKKNVAGAGHTVVKY